MSMTSNLDWLASVAAGRMNSFRESQEFHAVAANCFDELLAVARAGELFCDGRKKYNTGEHNRFDAFVDALAALDKKLGELRK